MLDDWPPLCPWRPLLPPERHGAPRKTFGNKYINYSPVIGGPQVAIQKVSNFTGWQTHCGGPPGPKDGWGYCQKTPIRKTSLSTRILAESVGEPQNGETHMGFASKPPFFLGGGAAVARPHKASFGKTYGLKRNNAEFSP